jgi:hypothetical protein
MRPPPRHLLAWTAGLTAAIEAVTLGLRFGGGVTAAEFNRTAPWVLQIHHMFWAVPVFAAALLVDGRPRLARGLWALAAALVVSDLVHHFVVLPLLVGNTGWHWP